MHWSTSTAIARQVHLLRPQASRHTSRLSAAFKLVAVVVLLLGAAAVAHASQNANATCRICTDVAADKAASADAGPPVHPEQDTGISAERIGADAPSSVRSSSFVLSAQKDTAMTRVFVS